MAKKYYAVRQGRKTGIFENWEECKAQVTGYSGAEYKGFTRLEDARAFLSGTGESVRESKAVRDSVTAVFTSVPQRREQEEGMGEEDTAVAYVDGSFNKKNGEFSCGVVFFYQGEETTFYQKFFDKELAAMHNVAGEIKGAEAAMRYAKEHQIKKLVIYHDYEGIAKWCTGAWKTNKEGTKAYKAFYEEMKQEMEIRFEKVKGHSGDKYNDMADSLAREALGL